MKTVREFLDIVEKLDGKSSKDKNYSLKDWFKGGGWVQAGGKYDGKPCAKQPGQTTKPYCRDPDDRASMTEKERDTAARKKRREDPNPNRSGKAKMVTQEAAGEKDACYKKVKSRYKVWPSAYACVPENGSKALTRNGWKSVDELQLQEEILTYSLEKDELEFKPILNIHRYKDAKTNVVRSGNTGFIFECTENHKWVINIPYQKGSTPTKYEKNNGSFLMETGDLLQSNKNKKIMVSAPYRGGSPMKKDLIYKYGDNWIEYILNISEEQRQTWLYSSIIYDGDQQKIQRKTEKPELTEELFWEYTGNYNKQSFGFKQKNIEHRDAFLLSAFLNLGTVTWKKSENRDIYSCYYVSNKRYKNTSNFNLVEERIADVWCPETENGTWVMAQETDGSGIITITGNSGALVKCRKVGASNWGNKTEEMDMFDFIYNFLISENLDEQDVLDIMARVPIEEILEVIEGEQE